MAEPSIPGAEAAPAATEATVPSSVAGSGGRFRGLGRVVFFFALIAVLAGLLHLFLNAGLRRIPTAKFGALNRVVEGRVNADVVIGGSSRALVHYDPRVIRAATGRSAWNLGMNAAHIDVQLAVLRTYLRHNKRPAVVIQNLDTFSLELTRRGEIYDPALFTPYLGEPDLNHALLAIDPAVWKWRHIPLYAYAVEDMNFTWVRALAAWVGVHPAEDYFSGFNPQALAWTEDFERFRASLKNGVTHRIDEGGVAALAELLKLGREQGIRMVLCFAPEYAEMQALDRNRAEVFARFRALAAQHGAEFWDFSDSPLCRDRENFYNSQHLNAGGAAKFSAEVAQRLKPLLP